LPVLLPFKRDAVVHEKAYRLWCKDAERGKKMSRRL
jgi:hypothetical protein